MKINHWFWKTSGVLLVTSLTVIIVLNTEKVRDILLTNGDENILHIRAASTEGKPTGSFDRDNYFPSLSDQNDYDRAWVSVTDPSANITSSQDTIIVTIKCGAHFTPFILKETGGATSLFTTTGFSHPILYPVGTTSGYIEDFNSGSHNYPALGTNIVGLNLKQFTTDTEGNADLRTNGELTVAFGDTLELLYGGSALDSASIGFNSGSFHFTPGAVTPVTTSSLSTPNLVISITDPDENLNPAAKDVIGYADNSALLAGSPGTGSPRVQIEAIDQTTGSTLSLDSTNIVAQYLMLVETGNNTGVFAASGKVFGSDTVTSSSLKGNLLVGSQELSAYAGQNITLGKPVANSVGCTFKIIEANASGRIGLYEAKGTTRIGGVGHPRIVGLLPVLGFTTGNDFTNKGTSSFGIAGVTPGITTTRVVAIDQTTCAFGSQTDNAVNQGTSASGLIKLIEGDNYCLVAISEFIATSAKVEVGTFSTYEGIPGGEGGSVTVTNDTFQLAGPRRGDTLKVSYLDEFASGGVSGTITGTLAYGVAGVTGTLAVDNTAPDINELVMITVVDGNLNTDSSLQESVAAGSSLWGGTTTNNRGDRLTVKNYEAGSKKISLSHPDGFAVGTQTIRISNTDHTLVWMIPTSLAAIFKNPLTPGSTTFSLGTESVSTIPLVSGSSSHADSFLSSASTSSFVATLDGLDNTVEISPDGTHWISIPVVEDGANTSTFIGTLGFDFTAVRATANSSTTNSTVFSDATGMSTITIQSDTLPTGLAAGLGGVIGTGTVVRISDGTYNEIAEVTRVAGNTLGVTKLYSTSSYTPWRTWIQTIGDDMNPARLDTLSSGSVIFRIGGYFGATYRIRYNDALNSDNAYKGGDTLAVTTSNMGFTTYTAALSTDITGSSGPNAFVVVTLVDHDINTSTSSKQTTFELNSTTSGTEIITSRNENGLGLPSGSSTGNVSTGFKNGGTAKILYASILGDILSTTVDQSPGGNTIDFLLSETDSNSGTFKGSFQLSGSIPTTNTGMDSNVSHGGILKVSNGNSVRVFYNDSPSAIAEDNSDSYMTTDPIFIVSQLGTLSLSKETAYLSGDRIVATVVDMDRNTNFTFADTLTTALKVTGTNYSAGTDLNLNLVENGVNTGTFLATFKTGIQTDTTTAPQVIKAVQDGVANVIYTDTIPSSSSVTKQVTFSASNAAMAFDADSYALDSFAKITLADAERNTSNISAQSLLSDVFIQTSQSNNTIVRMFESGSDTGTFLGSIKIASSGGTTKFSQIQALSGDTLKITYIDEVNTTLSSRTVTDTASVVEAATPIPTPTFTPTLTPAVTQTSKPTVTPTSTPTAMPTPKLTPTAATPIPAATPTTTLTPVCAAESIDATPSELEIPRKETDTVTVSVTGEDGCLVADQTVRAKIRSISKERIKVEPKEQITGPDGTVTFTIIAKNKTGKAMVKFKVKGKNMSAEVKVTVVK